MRLSWGLSLGTRQEDSRWHDASDALRLLELHRINNVHTCLLAMSVQHHNRAVRDSLRERDATCLTSEETFGVVDGDVLDTTDGDGPLGAVKYTVSTRVPMPDSYTNA